jgi:hypothetical protein
MKRLQCYLDSEICRKLLLRPSRPLIFLLRLSSWLRSERSGYEVICFVQRCEWQIAASESGEHHRAAVGAPGLPAMNQTPDLTS